MRCEFITNTAVWNVKYCAVKYAVKCNGIHTAESNGAYTGTYITELFNCLVDDILVLFFWEVNVSMTIDYVNRFQFKNLDCF